MTIFESLRNDHDIQRKLLTGLVETHGDSDKRKELFFQLKNELNAHAIAEERNFYLPLIESDLTQEKSRHSIAEHHEIEELIEELESMDFSSPQWLPKAKHLKERVFHHLEEEETEVFQLAGKALEDSEKTRFAKPYEKEMETKRLTA